MESLTADSSIDLGGKEITKHCIHFLFINILNRRGKKCCSSLPPLNEMFSCTAGHETFILVPCVPSPEKP